jgi:hypothetical protein
LRRAPSARSLDRSHLSQAATWPRILTLNLLALLLPKAISKSAGDLFSTAGTLCFPGYLHEDIGEQFSIFRVHDLDVFIEKISNLALLPS